MTSQYKKELIRHLVRENEIKSALESLKDRYRLNPTAIISIILVERTFNDVKNKDILGLMTNIDSNMEYSKISKKILDINEGNLYESMITFKVINLTIVIICTIILYLLFYYFSNRQSQTSLVSVINNHQQGILTDVESTISICDSILINPEIDVDFKKEVAETKAKIVRVNDEAQSLINRAKNEIVNRRYEISHETFAEIHNLSEKYELQELIANNLEIPSYSDQEIASNHEIKPQFQEIEVHTSEIPNGNQKESLNYPEKKGNIKEPTSLFNSESIRYNSNRAHDEKDRKKEVAQKKKKVDELNKRIGIIRQRLNNCKGDTN